MCACAFSFRPKFDDFRATKNYSSNLFAFQPKPERQIELDYNGEISTNLNVSGGSEKKMSQRRVERIEKFARLPVWPAWNGVFIFLLSKMFGSDMGAKIEDWIGGRVCPNFFVPEQTSPFIMLVHHRHSFAPWDPLRFVQKSFFPEGFPAHPHRGFVTITYCLKGGMIHRDSMGNKQLYGAETHHKGRHTQWLTAGAGMLHEEMWDVRPDENICFKPSSQELYQLWLNLPASRKMCSPDVQLLGNDDTPTVSASSSSTVILCGEHAGEKAKIQPSSDVAILHVRIEPASTWKHSVPKNHETCILYMRKGSVSIDATAVPAHHTCFLSCYGDTLSVINSDLNGPADFLFLSGQPLKEPVSAQGSMVMNYPDEINSAYSDYQSLKMGAPWDHKINDDEWADHTKKFPSMYNK